MIKPDINVLLSTDGKISPTKLKSCKFLTQKLQKQIYEYTIQLNVFNNINITERVIFIRDNLNINYCKKCNAPWIKFSNLNRSTFQLCKHRKRDIKHCTRSLKKKNGILYAIELIKNNEIQNREKELMFWIAKANTVKQFGFKNIFSHDVLTAAYILNKTQKMIPINIDDIKMSERLYILKENLSSIPTCQNCGTVLTYANFNMGYYSCSKCLYNTTKHQINKNKNMMQQYFLQFDQYECLNLNELTLISNFIFKIKHKSCGNIFKRRLDCGKAANNVEILCPYCSPNQSKGQLEVYDFVKNIFPTTILSYNNRRGLKHSYQIDVYIPELRFGIEYNGDFWHSLNNNTPPGYHYNKYIKAKNDGINIIQIFEHEWKNKQAIVIDLIKRNLNLIVEDNIEYFIQKAGFEQTIEFLYTNHIQSCGNFTHSYKVVDKNNIIFAMLTINNINNNYYIDRFCYKLNTKINCLQKLLLHICNSLKICTLYLVDELTYQLYTQFINIGFVKQKILQPQIFKVANGKSYLRHNTDNIHKNFLEVQNAGYILYKKEFNRSIQ